MTKHQNNPTRSIVGKQCIYYFDALFFFKGISSTRALVKPNFLIIRSQIQVSVCKMREI